MSNEGRSIYRLEVWITAICFIIVSITGGFFSSLVVILNERFISQVPTPEQLIPFYGESMYVANPGPLGFPSHYFWLIVLSWIGVTLIGAIWCLVMDRIEEKQRL